MPGPGAGAKKAAEKPKKGSAATDNALAVEDEKVFLQRQVDALKLQLEKESMRAMQVDLQIRDLRSRDVDLQSAITASEEKTLTISLDMARQYRSMQQQLTQDIEALKAKLDAAALDKVQAEAKWAAERVEWEGKVAACQAVIAGEREKNAELTAEFAVMLQSTLEKMGRGWKSAMNGTEETTTHPHSQ